MKSWLKTLMFARPDGRAWLMDRWSNVPQPSDARAQILITHLGTGGLDAHGKVDAWRYYPAFCAALRARGYRTHFVWSLETLRRRLGGRGLPSVLLHVFGEDHCSISGPEVAEAEAQAALVFNSSETGMLLADKGLSQEAFARYGVPVPEFDPPQGPALVRRRFGTAQPVRLLPDGGETTGTEQVVTRFVDTRRQIDGQTYATIVRLYCVGGRVLHINPRAAQADGPVARLHTNDMPLDPQLVEALYAAMAEPFRSQYEAIATKMCAALGHGLYAHDVLVERGTDTAFVCESGFKLYPTDFINRVFPMRHALPSHAILTAPERWPRLQAECVADQCDALPGVA